MIVHTLVKATIQQVEFRLDRCDADRPTEHFRAEVIQTADEVREIVASLSFQHYREARTAFHALLDTASLFNLPEARVAGPDECDRCFKKAELFHYDAANPNGTDRTFDGSSLCDDCCTILANL